MKLRPLQFGLFATVAAYLFAQLVKSGLELVFIEPFSGLYPSFILEALYSLPWLIGGFTAGYFSVTSPLKNGAIVGGTYGTIFCLIGIAMLASQTHDLESRLSQLNYSAVAIIRLTVLFTLSAGVGHTMRTRATRPSN
ncbi:hypothetical protein [Stutzerimonas nosocomialis]|uniref:hypothetical protein n=1 Tax=Stutzerimonas nosocomialis TaxID=1056496 RepID=UPI0011080E82|nr:hypothetical protein [Stutzerimonas nosocomialis]